MCKFHNVIVKINNMSQALSFVSVGNLNILNICRLFGTTGYCAACNKVIPAFEMVMRAKSNVYHLECFACQQCNHR